MGRHKGSKKSDALYRLQGVFGSERGFKYARIVGGCIEHGKYFKRGDLLVEMDKETFEALVSARVVVEANTAPGCYFLTG